MTRGFPVQRSERLASLLIAWPQAEQKRVLHLLQEYVRKTGGGRRRAVLHRQVHDLTELVRRPQLRNDAPTEAKGKRIHHR